MLLSEALHSNTLVPVEYIDGQVILFFFFIYFCNVGDGCEGISFHKVSPSFVGYLKGLSIWSVTGNRPTLKACQRQFVHVHNSFLFFTHIQNGDNADKIGIH